MKKIMLSLILTLLLAKGVQANEESNINVERFTIDSNMPLHLDKNVQDIVIHKVILIDDNYGRGRFIILAEVITTEGKRIKKQYEKSVEAGHDYYHEMLSGPLKTLEDEGKIKTRQ